MNVCGYELGVQETTSVFPPLSGWRKAPLTKPSLLMGPRERRQGRVSLCKESLPQAAWWCSTVCGELSVAMEWHHRIMSTVDGLCWQVVPGQSKAGFLGM